MLDYVKRHLGVKVTILVLVVSVIVFTGLAVVTAAWRSEDFRASLEQSVGQTSELLYHAIAKPMVVGDDAGTREQFDFIREKYPDVQVYLTNFRGNITYTTTPDHERIDLDEALPMDGLHAMSEQALKTDSSAGKLLQAGDKHVFVRVDSIRNRQSCHHCHGASQPILGEMVVMQDVTPAIAGMNMEIAKFVGLCVAGLVILVASVVIFLRRQVVRNVGIIAKASRDITAGDLSADFNVSTSDELGQMSHTLAEMVDKLKKQLGFSEGVLKGITLPCVISRQDGTISYMNRQLCEYLGKPGSPEQYKGQLLGEFFYGDAKHVTTSCRALETKRQVTEEITYATPDGRNLTVEVTATPFHDMDGKLLGTLAIWFDLTEIRANEERINEQNQRMTGAAQEAEAVSSQVASASEELAAQVEQSTHGADDQQQRIAEVATAMEEMNATVIEVARNAGNAAEMAEQVRNRAREGHDVVNSSVELVNVVSQQAQELRQSMTELGAKADGVGQVITTIEDIADQTNLLALNAAIEAARAGDAGRGFAVVADEVRKLAERTMAATKEVTDSIKEIQESANLNVRGTEKAVDAVERSRDMAHQSGEVLQDIVRVIEQTADQVRTIATAAEQQSATSEEIANATEGIRTIASETSVAMDESTRAISDLAGLAQRLQTVIETMRSK
ncbi:methyl-accepting chemotaxis protein [Desulfobaculum sp.]